LEPIGQDIALFCRRICGAIDVETKAPDRVFLVFEIPNGQERSLGYGITVSTKATALSAVEAIITADFSGSIHWDGIVRVEDTLTGELVDDWTVTSRSGFDYSRPFRVPEPSSLLLLAIALSALSSLRRR
jgi:hypothetical protein